MPRRFTGCRSEPWAIGTTITCSVAKQRISQRASRYVVLASMNSRRKKHRQFVAVIVDHDNRCVLEVLENRDKATVVAYLKKAKQDGLLAQVEEVTTDMWDAYVTAAREVFGDDVVITIDRFHVMKNFQEYLTGARRELQRNLSERER